MPQFDPEVFSSQIFWLLICFSLLYFFASKVILPRITDIVEKRENRIKSDELIASSMEKKVSELDATSEKLRANANLTYQKSIESVLKDCALKREKLLNKSKDDIAKMDVKSEKKIADFISKSLGDFNSSATGIAGIIVKKLFGKDSNFKENIEVKINK